MEGGGRDGVASQTRRHAGAFALAILGSAFVVVLVRSPELVTSHLHTGQIPHTAGLVLERWADTFLAPLFWVFLGLVVALELRFPARSGEGTFSTGAAQDLVWFVLLAGVELTIVRLYFVLLDGVDAQFIGGPVVDLPGALGPVGAAVFAFVAIDLLLWVAHYARHHVPTLWHFHEVHHSQRSMSLFTDSRTHFVESLVASTVAFVPSALLGLQVNQAVAIATASLFYQRFFHANIRTNLGPLRHVLVTPQSHRIHHSSLVEHHDRNYGVILSVWDRLFGTRHADDTEYPATGLPDSAVPIEHSHLPSALLRTYARQTVYPFLALRRARVTSD